jgi:hypothetical protein
VIRCSYATLLSFCVLLPCAVSVPSIKMQLLWILDVLPV